MINSDILEIEKLKGGVTNLLNVNKVLTDDGLAVQKEQSDKISKIKIKRRN